MKRQIIKTRPVKPYRVVRIVLAIVIVALLAALGYLFARPHAQPAHAGAMHVIDARQDLTNASMKSRSPAILT